MHKVARDAGDPERLYAQNHHGVYRSDDGGRTWPRSPTGCPATSASRWWPTRARPGMIWTFPLVADGERFPPDHRCRVYRSADAGGKWEPLSEGLPDGPFYPAVLRDAMCADDADPGRGLLRHPLRRGLRQPRRGRLLVPVAAHLPDVLASAPRWSELVTVLLPGPLRGEAGGAASAERRPPPATLRRGPRRGGRAQPRLARRIRDERGELRRYVNVFVDGEDCRHSGGLATPVGDGAEVQVLPSVAGG